MSDALQLYSTVLVFLFAVPCADVRQVFTLAWLVTGLLLSHTVNLDEWATRVVSRAQLAASTICRFRRWFHHPGIQVHPLYAPLIRQALVEWNDQRLQLALDTSQLWHEFCVVRVALLYRGRAIPLAWQVLAHPSCSVAYAVYAPLLEQVAAMLPQGAQVVLTADRGFVAQELRQHCKRLGWHWRVRVKATCKIYRHGRSYQVGQVRVERGQACFLDHVHLTADYYGPLYLAVAYPLTGAERWYVISDEPASLSTLEEYGQRFDIEENFLDDKSNGFQLPDSRLRDAAVLTRLGLVLAIGTLFLVLQGVAVQAVGHRRWVDPHWGRGQSYFKIGWHWLHRALSRGWPLRARWRLPSGPDPEPAQASAPQAAARRAPPFISISAAQAEPAIDNADC